jgi:UDP-galactopyranose mutase
MSPSTRKVLVVGAGFSGAVIARVLAESGFSIDIVDKRGHIGGNAWDYLNDHGIRIHKYGPHLFHTNNSKVFEWLSRFTDWVPYKHRVKAMLSDGRLVTLPVNRETSAIVGRENLIETFERPYSEKMWGMPLERLDPKVFNRVPFRDDLNEYYFPDDEYQFMPENGYASLFVNILNHPGIRVYLETSFDKSMEKDYLHVFNSMPIDQYFDYCHGDLPYRSIRFHHVDLPLPRVFDVVQVNFTHRERYTRVIEWKNIPGHGVNESFTSLTYEEPCDYRNNALERFYPVKDVDGENRRLYNLYRDMVGPNMTFVGRLGMYAYLDMHQCVSSALKVSEDYIQTCLKRWQIGQSVS